MKIKKLISKANRFIRKDNIILFNSFPSYSDNAKAIYEYIISNRQDISAKYRLIWTIDDDNAIPDNIKCVKKKSFKGLFLFLRAKYIISTHNYFDSIYSGNEQKQINLWHGCGYKSIPKEERVYRGDETIVTSDIYRQIHSEELSIPVERVHVTGLPRNDMLFENKNVLAKLLGERANQFKKIYIWMPTYRKASMRHEMTDGRIDSFGVGIITKEQFELLNNVLESQKALLIVKPHPMDSISIDKIKGFSNIICLTSEDLKRKEIDLYNLLSETDVLLSDYSSVITDYLLLDKPIVMVLADKEEYKESRGFVFDPVENYFPGPIISDFKAFISYFNNPELEENGWKERRQSLTKTFHKYLDGRSCERVCNLFWGEVK